MTNLTNQANCFVLTSATLVAVQFVPLLGRHSRVRALHLSWKDSCVTKLPEW
jgi:hypothetical protein